MLKFKHSYGNTWPVGFIIQQLLESKLYGRLISVYTGIIDLIFNFNNIFKVQNLPGSKPFGKKRLFCLLIARKWLLVSSAGGRYLVISLFTLKQSVSQKVIPWVCLSKGCGTKREKEGKPRRTVAILQSDFTTQQPFQWKSGQAEWVFKGQCSYPLLPYFSFAVDPRVCNLQLLFIPYLGLGAQEDFSISL